MQKNIFGKIHTQQLQVSRSGIWALLMVSTPIARTLPNGYDDLRYYEPCTNLTPFSIPGGICQF
jgi:hypothetical protein